MSTTHKVIHGDATTLNDLQDESINLVVTSPPYPMIEMWDGIFSAQDSRISTALKNGDGNTAFELMHQLLDRAWAAVYRVLKPSGFACINIGDATRTIRGHFRLYSNHARILSCCLNLGFTNLPAIIWRKQTNAPNKFMGSGMLPAGAYVTLEHEFILVLRKGNKRRFDKTAEKSDRQRSAYFWEERNIWFSDVWWDLKGTGQIVNNGETRKRSGAFPFEVPYRLINMYSQVEDTVLDPFAGTGTTTVAAIASGRNSVGVELDQTLQDILFDRIARDGTTRCNERIKRRVLEHLAFVDERDATKGTGSFKYTNEHFGFPVMTRHERKLVLNYVKQIRRNSDTEIMADYISDPILDYTELDSLFACAARGSKK